MKIPVAVFVTGALVFLAALSAAASDWSPRLAGDIGFAYLGFSLASVIGTIWWIWLG